MTQGGFNDFSVGQFVEFLRDRLASAYAESPTAETAFLALSASDPAQWSPPAEVIARFARQLDPVTLGRFKIAIGEAITLARPELIPVAAVRDLIYTVALVQGADALVPTARALGMAELWGEDLRRLQEDLLMVLKGMAGTRAAYEAARLLVGYPSFPDELLLDALDVMIVDPAIRWDSSLVQMEDRLLVACRRDRGFSRRLKFFAEGSMHRLSDIDIAAGLKELTIADRQRADHRHPIGKLMQALVNHVTGPFHVVIKDSRYWLASRAANTRVSWDVPSELALFLSDRRDRRSSEARPDEFKALLSDLEEPQEDLDDAA
jgi:hypothetical protein